MLYNDWDYVGDEKGVGQSYGDLATSIEVGGQVIRSICERKKSSQRTQAHSFVFLHSPSPVLMLFRV